MGQHLGLYDYSKILNSIDDLHISDATKQDVENAPNITNIRFKWSWQGYSGNGDIYLKNGVLDYNDIWCRDSILRINSDSAKKAIKQYSTLYNEKSLLNLFEFIKNKVQGGEL